MAFVIPYTLLRHPNYTRLSPYAHKLVQDLARQYTGFSNGYLCASWALMQDAHWNSENTVRKAAAELEHYRIIERTKQGGGTRPRSMHSPGAASTGRRTGRSTCRPPQSLPIAGSTSGPTMSAAPASARNRALQNGIGTAPRAAT